MKIINHSSPKGVYIFNIFTRKSWVDLIVYPIHMCEMVRLVYQTKHLNEKLKFVSQRVGQFVEDSMKFRLLLAFPFTNRGFEYNN